MTITAEIVEDSISQAGIRITTFLLRYPRFIHAELMTHRVFSRNASSSRAIPAPRLIADIRRDPAMFEFWGRNQKGMQASEELTGWELRAVQFLWLAGMWIMTTLALLAHKMGAHKQTVNRMVEPWSHITVVVTSTSYANWFALRDHPDAMPEVMWLARYMNEAYVNHSPKRLPQGQWHTPFVDGFAHQEILQHLFLQDPDRDWKATDPEWIDLAIKVSVARCARTSYRTHDNRVATVEEELKLYDRLVDRTPLHASPTEHQATPDEPNTFQALYNAEGFVVRWDDGWKLGQYHGNFEGWVQYRKLLPFEFVADERNRWDHLAHD